MPVVGISPSDGHRLELHRDAANRVAPWRYTGALALAEGASIAVDASVSESGEVVFPDGSALAPEHRERVERTLRMALKHARQDDPAAAPPRRITRWRGDDGR
jgi:hypothetical protein